MKLHLNKDRCSGHAQCELAAPQLIALNEEGYASVPDDPIPAELMDTARAAVSNCPERALTLTDD